MNTRRRLVRGLAAVAGLLGVAIPVAMAGGWGSSYTYLSTDTGAQTQEGPAVAVSGKGDVAALWLDEGTSTTAGTATLDARSDTGSGFGAVAEVTTTADPLAAFDSDYPQVAEDAAGDTVAVWLSNGSLMAGYRAAGSSSFTDSTIDSTSYPAQDQFPQLAIDSAGDAVVTWQQYENEYGTYSVHYATLSAGSSTFGAAQSLQSGMPLNGDEQPDPHVAVNASGAAVIVWVDINAEAIDYAYSSSLTNPSFAMVAGATNSGSFLSYPVVAIAADGNAAVAWDQGVEGGYADVYEADLPAATASSQGALENAGAVSTNTGDGRPFDSTSQEYPAIAMKASTAGDDTTALAFYDIDDNEVAALIRPSDDYGVSWSSLLDSSLYSTEGQDWVEESSNDYAEPQITLTSSAAGDDGPLTMIWTDGNNGISSITSDASGTFGAPVALSSSPNEGNCDTADSSCAELAANASGDVAALWQQNDNSPSPHIQVVADCYQASTSVTVTTSSDPSACDSLAPTTTTTATTTTGTTPTPTTTGTTPTSTGTTATTQTATTAAPTPKLAQTIVVSSSTGDVMVILPGSNTPVPLSSLTQFPSGSVIDPGSGTVTLSFALPDGTTETGTFWGGDFKVLQAPGGGVDLTLTGGSFKGCPKPTRKSRKSNSRSTRSSGRDPSASVAKAKKKKPGSPVRSLWSNAKGNFTTKGDNGAAAVLGTSWLTRDQCNGTYFYVKSTSNDPHGAIEVTVLHPHKHRVRLKRGHHLLAPAPGYS